MLFTKNDIINVIAQSQCCNNIEINPNDFKTVEDFSNYLESQKIYFYKTFYTCGLCKTLDYTFIYVFGRGNLCSSCVESFKEELEKYATIESEEKS